jgi:hypothetical protein
MQLEVPYDLSATESVHVLMIHNTYDSTTGCLPSLVDRKDNASLLRATLEGLKSVSITSLCNVTSSEMREATAKFVKGAEEKVDTDGHVVTLFYFSGYGVGYEADREESFLCTEDCMEKSLELPYRLNADYLQLMQRVPGLHMLLLDCCDVNGSLRFRLPVLPPRFHALYTDESQAGFIDVQASPLTRVWCDQLHLPGSLEDHAKRVRISLLLSYDKPFTSYECSTLLNHFEFQ